jgi:protein-S-isoprenylcysteine O-methyltransferase Ste14
MPTQQLLDSKPQVVAPAPVAADTSVRDLAIKQIERKRRFLTRAVIGTALIVMLVIIWAISEYHNAGGWPTDGFSQSSSIPHVWNIWIIYPVCSIALILAVDGWFTYFRKPISEREIQREIDRLTEGGGGVAGQARGRSTT